MSRSKRFILPLLAVLAAPHPVAAAPDLSIDSLFVCALSDSELSVAYVVGYAADALGPATLQTTALMHFPCTVRDTQFITYETPPNPHEGCNTIAPPGCPQGMCPMWLLRVKKHNEEEPPPMPVQPRCTRTPPPLFPRCICAYEHVVLKQPKWPYPHENTYVIVTVDPDNLLPESDEQNNSRSFVVTDNMQRCDQLGVGPGSAASVSLGPSVPNPMRSDAEFVFQVAARGTFDVVILDAQGRRVRSLRRGMFEPGEHRVRWDGRDAKGLRVRPGAYFYAARGDDREVARKLIVIQ